MFFFFPVNYSEASTPSMSSTDSDEVSMKSKNSPVLKAPIRKPLQFASNVYRKPPTPMYSPNLPTSYSTSCFQSYPSNFSLSGLSVHSGLCKIANEPVEVAPGLLDLSSVKAYRLQRTYSAPICPNLLTDSRKVSFKHFFQN